MNNNDVNSETIWWNQNKKLYQIKLGSYFGYFSIFHKQLYENIPGKVLQSRHFSVGIFICHKNNSTRVRNGLIPCVNAFTMRSKIVYSATAKMFWPISLGNSGRQLFVATKWIYKAIRSCIIKNTYFVFCNFSWPTFWIWSDNLL